MSKSESMLEYVREEIVNHIIDCPSFSSIYSMDDYLFFQKIIRCNCGKTWKVDGYLLIRDSSSLASNFFRMLQEGQCTMEDNNFKVLVQRLRADRGRVRKEKAEETKAKEAIRLQMIQAEKEKQLKRINRIKMSNPISSLEL
jgi:hypothetical protein